MNLDSDNFIAETLAKGVGAAGAGRGTTTAGVAAHARPAAERGHPGPAATALVDGSGLSRDNRLAASSLVRLVAAGRRRPRAGARP